jgi:tetratricopeptide (TPR) repeat protein/DNA-binding CsgD family transcriptional regulator
VLYQIKKIIFLVSICCFCFSAQSANISKLDSLTQLLNTENYREDQKSDLLFNLSLEEYQLQHYPEAINYASQALAIYKTDNNKKKEAKVLEYLGIYYAEFSDYQNSIKYLLEALSIAEELNIQKSIYSKKFNIGTTFIEAGNYVKGIEFIKSSIDFFEIPKYKNVTLLVAGYTNLGVAYNEMNILDSAMFYYQVAANIAKQENYPTLAGAPLLNIGEIHLKQNNISKALDLFNQSLDAFEKTQDSKGISHTKFAIANTYAKQGKTKEAIDLLEKIIPHFRKTNDLSYIEKSLTTLSYIYETEHNYKLALNYKKQLFEVKDSISESEILNKIAELETQYRIEKLQEENQSQLELLQEKKKMASLRWYGATGILIIVIILIITLYKKSKTQKDLAEAQLQKTELEQIKLKDELAYRNKELENFALHIVQKNDFLLDVKTSLKEIKANANEDNIDEIKNLTFKINQALRVNKELEKFRDRVDDVNSNFFKTLTQNYPDLTEKEKRLCALLKLNLSSKEIATLNNISEGAVTMARYRLRKKIGLKTDENLVELFQKLN